MIGLVNQSVDQVCVWVRQNMVKLVNLLIDLEIVSLFIVSFETFDELAILFDNKLITTHNTIHIQNESKL